LEGLICRKGGMKRYWVLVKTHLDVSKRTMGIRDDPTSRYGWGHMVMNSFTVIARVLPAYLFVPCPCCILLLLEAKYYSVSADKN
jgi:hypothetical protein